MSKTFGNKVDPAELMHGGNEEQAEKNEQVVTPQNVELPKDSSNSQSESAYVTRSVEKKTRKTLIVLPPSLHEKAKNLADEMEISFNEFACQALSEKIKNEKSKNTDDYKG